MKASGVRALLIGLLMASACARGVKPDDMSAHAHRAEADYEHAVARYPDYNPTEWRLTEAARRSAHAREHEHAAAALEAYEEAECQAFSPSRRASCPFFGPIVSVEEISGGVRVMLSDGAPVEALVAHMRCHLAHARTLGLFESECPLALRGVEAVATVDGRGILLTSRDGKIVTLLRRRATALMHGGGL